MPENKVSRIEQSVNKLERDMAVMSAAVTRTATAVEALAETHLEIKLLRKDYENTKADCEKSVNQSLGKVEKIADELEVVKKAQIKNSLIASAGTWFVMTIIGTIVAVFGFIVRGK